MHNFILSYSEYLNESNRWVSNIKQYEVNDVIEEIKETLLPYLNIDESAISVIGSAGKLKGDVTSYNINIAIDNKSLLESNDIIDNGSTMFIKSIIEELGYSSVTGDDILMVDWPIKGESNRVVEVRIQPTDNFEWVNFMRYSPNLNEDESQYHGKYRELILKSIVESINKKIISYFDRNENVKEYKKYVLDINEGVYSVIKTFDGKKGHSYSAREVDGSRRLVTNNVNEFVTFLFGEGVNEDDIMTFESILERVNCEEFPYKKKRKQIMERFKGHCRRNNLKLPDDINKSLV